MRLMTIFRVVKSFHFFIIPNIFIAALLILSFSCRKEKVEEKPKAPTVTMENLQTAYAKELNKVKMYKLFIMRAEKDKMKQVVKLYRAITRSEEIHAMLHLELLKKLGIQTQQPPEETIPVGTTLQTLKMSLSMEDIEYGSMYPNLIKTANAEKYEEAIKHFAKVQDADSKHAELIRYAISQNGIIPSVKYYICPYCGYIIESKNVPECPTCKTKIIDFEVIS